MAAPLRTGRAALAQRLAGLLFLAVIAALVAATVLIYTKAFTPVVRVTLMADRVGNQLTPGADVKLRGLIVGEVRSVESEGAGARLELALQPEMAALVPADVTARLLPKTLFGEKFVALVLPDGPAGRPITEGAVIPQDRSATSIETEQVLNDLLPLLQALEADQLSTTLNALSTALRGRGEVLGANAVRTRDYLAQLNPALPDLQADLVGLADFSDTLDQTAPDLLATLDNLSFSSRALVDQEQELAAFLSSSTGFSDSLETLLADNEARLIALNTKSVPVLALYARYAPGFPCLTSGVVRSTQVIQDTFGGLQPGLRIRLEPTRDLEGYEPGEEPLYLTDTGPVCFGLDGDPIIPFPVNVNPDDGYEDGVAVDPRTGRPAEASGQTFAAQAAVAPLLGVPPEQVSDLAELLFAPAARGTTVSLR